MPQNDFLPWGIGVGANVEDQADYAASDELSVGYAVGQSPPSPSFNKALRQSSAMAALLASVIVAITGLNMVDDGNTATQLANFMALLQQANIVNYLNDTGAANVMVVTPATPWTAYSKQSLTIIPNHANTIAGVTLNVSGLGAKSVVRIDGTALLPGDIPVGGAIQVVYQPTIGKFVLLTVNQAPSYTVGAAGGPGNVTIPGTPLILQWFTTSVVTNNSANMPSGVYFGQANPSLPLSFPNGSLVAWAQSGTPVNGQFNFATITGPNWDSGNNVWGISAINGATVPVTMFVLGH